MEKTESNNQLRQSRIDSDAHVKEQDNTWSGKNEKKRQSKIPVKVDNSKLDLDRQKKGKTPGLHAVEDEERESSQESSDVEDMSSDCNIISTVIKLKQPTQYWSAVHKKAALRTTEGAMVRDAIVLFDTGASSGNYLSTSFVEDNNLSSDLRSGQQRVKVANGGIVTIKWKLRLTLSFDEQHSADNLEFYVLGGTVLGSYIGASKDPDAF